jgi:hypothetical protein
MMTRLTREKGGNTTQHLGPRKRGRVEEASYPPPVGELVCVRSWLSLELARGECCEAKSGLEDYGVC